MDILMRNIFQSCAVSDGQRRSTRSEDQIRLREWSFSRLNFHYDLLTGSSPRQSKVKRMVLPQMQRFRNDFLSKLCLGISKSLLKSYSVKSLLCWTSGIH